MSAAFSYRFISWLALAFGLVSMVYFLSLVAGAPFWCAVFIAAIGSAGLGIWLFRDKWDKTSGMAAATAFPILIAGIVLLFFNAFPVMEKWGGWDAWAIWNHRAAMLEDPVFWQRSLISEGNDHSDYPLCLPAGLAFINRLLPFLETGSAAMGVAWGTSLSIVLLLFSLLFTARRWVGTGVLLLLATNAAFLKNGLSQYADTLLALFFLLAIASWKRIDTDNRAAAVFGAALGLCCWTKNEGVILCVSALLFLGTKLLRQKRWKPFLLGFLLPVSVWILFKTAFAPPGDMLASSTKNSWMDRLAETERYTLVWTVLRENVVQSFSIPALAMLAYPAIRVWRKRLPGADFMLICALVLAYCSIYLVTPQDPEWHLRTSLDRLLHQLMPAAVFVCGSELSRLRFYLADEHAD